MKPGDHLVTPRTGYTHHGLYLGHNEVIHYSGLASDMSSGPIEITTLDNFSQGKEIIVDTHLIRVYNHQESIERALSRLGEDEYDVLYNNCEHFVYWCIKNFQYSSQVEGRILAYIAYRAAMSKMTEQLIARYLIGGTITQALGSTVTASSLLSTTTTATSLVSSSAGTVAGLAASAGITSSTGAATAIAAGLTATTTAAPVIVAAAVGLGVGYGVKKLIDWIWD